MSSIERTQPIINTQLNPSPASTTAANDTTTSEPGKKAPLLTPAQIIAGGIAAITAAACGSLLGTTGTIIGAGVMSVVTTMGSAIYTQAWNRTKSSVFKTQPESFKDILRSLHYKRLAIFAAIVALLGVGAIFVGEKVSGHNLSTITGIAQQTNGSGGGSTAPAPVPTQTDNTRAQPEVSPTPTDTHTVFATPVPTVTIIESPAPTVTVTMTATPSATPTASPSDTTKPSATAVPTGTPTAAPTPSSKPSTPAPTSSVTSSPTQDATTPDSSTVDVVK